MRLKEAAISHADLAKFPADFMFTLSEDESAGLRINALPKTQQKFVMQMIEMALAQAATQGAAR